MSRHPDRITTYEDDHDTKGKTVKIKKNDKCRKAKVTEKMTLAELQELIIKKRKEK